MFYCSLVVQGQNKYCLLSYPNPTMTHLKGRCLWNFPKNKREVEISFASIVNRIFKWAYYIWQRLTSFIHLLVLFFKYLFAKFYDVSGIFWVNNTHVYVGWWWYSSLRMACPLCNESPKNIFFSRASRRNNTRMAEGVFMPILQYGVMNDLW